MGHGMGRRKLILNREGKNVCSKMIQIVLTVMTL